MDNWLITRASIFVHERTSTRNPLVTWTHDHTAVSDGGGPGGTNVRSFEHVVLHELGHALGVPHTLEPRCVMVGDVTPLQPPAATHAGRSGGVLWYEDIYSLTCTSNPQHYGVRADRRIQHERSTDGGLTWAPEDWSDAQARHTSVRVGVAQVSSNLYAAGYKVAGLPYLHAGGEIRLLRTNGLSNPQNEWTSATASLGGPSVADGGGVTVPAGAVQHDGAPADRLTGSIGRPVGAQVESGASHDLHLPRRSGFRVLGARPREQRVGSGPKRRRLEPQHCGAVQASPPGDEQHRGRSLLVPLEREPHLGV